MTRNFAVISAAGLILGACVHHSGTTDATPLPVKADVAITEDGSGGYEFSYNAPFADADGNFDFSQQGAAYNAIALTFEIADGSVPGISFKADPTDAIWIVEKVNADQSTGSPKGPYRGNQFYDFAVSSDGQSLTVTDRNDDGVLYRYGLQFDLEGKTVAHDPDVQNGGHN